MVGEPKQGKRGPAPNPDRGTPTGYRVNARQRHELRMAANFVGADSLQDTIQVAVDEFLIRMRKTPGFTAALASAERSQRERAGIKALPRREPEDEQ